MLNTNTITNTELIDLWLHGKSTNTVDGYRRYAERCAHLLQKTLGHSSVAITEVYLHAKSTDSSGLYLPDDD